MYNFETEEELFDFLQENIISTMEAAEILGCSRQYIDQLVKENKLVPVKIYPRNKIFLKSTVLARKKS